MKYADAVIRLYRVVDENEVLKSKEPNRLSIHLMNEEIISHELSSKTKRGVLFSFTTRLEVARDYAERYEKRKICYVDISLHRPAQSVVEIIPVFDRDFWFNRFALDNILLKDGMLVNPATKRCHTVVGLTNYSQRTASGWASSLNEVMLQVNGLELKDLSNMSGYISAEETEQLLREYYIQEMPASNIMELRSLVKNTFDIVNLKRKCLLDLVNGDSWYRVA